MKVRATASGVGLEFERESGTNAREGVAIVEMTTSTQPTIASGSIAFIVPIIIRIVVYAFFSSIDMARLSLLCLFL